MNTLHHSNPPSALTTDADEATFTVARETESPPLPPEAAAEPTGTLVERRHTGTRVYPGVARDYAVYSPANLEPATPAALLVFHDGRF